MSSLSRALFLALVLTQAAHSVEEFVFALWEVWPLARFASGLVSSHIPTGFAVLNSAFVLFGLACYLGPVSRGWPSARSFAWIWVAVELANGIFHPALAMRAGGYFPGAATAPLLLVLAVALALGLRRDGGREAAHSV